MSRKVAKPVPPNPKQQVLNFQEAHKGSSLVTRKTSISSEFQDEISQHLRSIQDFEDDYLLVLDLDNYTIKVQIQERNIGTLMESQGLYQVDEVFLDVECQAPCDLKAMGVYASQLSEISNIALKLNKKYGGLTYTLIKTAEEIEAEKIKDMMYVRLNQLLHMVHESLDASDKPLVLELGPQPAFKTGCYKLRLANKRYQVTVDEKKGTVSFEAQ